MDYKIKPLTPALVTDYLEFFDQRAFTDDSPMHPCYCCSFNMTDEEEERDISGQIEANGGGTEGLTRSLRKAAEGLIQEGRLKGYLAFAEGVSVGWCNANDKANYCRLDTAVEDNYAGRTKSVVCFEIDPAYRGKGIASALLTQVIEDARTEGYVAVEGYPRLHEGQETFDYNGPVELYEKCGFVKVAQQGNELIMRKEL